MPKNNRVKKGELARYCRIFGHTLSAGQCVVCKMSLSKLVENGEIVLPSKGSESDN